MASVYVYTFLFLPFQFFNFARSPFILGDNVPHTEIISHGWGWRRRCRPEQGFGVGELRRDCFPRSDAAHAPHVDEHETTDPRAVGAQHEFRGQKGEDREGHHGDETKGSSGNHAAEEQTAAGERNDRTVQGGNLQNSGDHVFVLRVRDVC